MSSILSFKQLLLKISSVSFFTSLLLLFTSLILAKIMVPEDFGKYSYFQSILVVLINIFPLATSLSLSLQLYKSKKDKSNRVINNTLFSIFPIMMLLCVGIIFCLSFIIDLDKTFYPILFNTLLMAFVLIVIDYYRMIQDIKFYSILLIVYTLTLTISTLISYYFTKDVFYIYLINFFTLMIPAIICFKSFQKKFTIDYKFTKKWLTLKWSIKFGFAVVLSTVTMSLMVTGDKIILGSFVEEKKLAFYAIAALISSTSLFVVNNFASAWTSYLFNFLPQYLIQDNNDIYKYYTSNLKFLLFSIPIFFVLYLSQCVIYSFFYFDKYPGLYSSIFFLTLGYTVFGLSKYLMGFVNYLNKNILILQSSVLSLCVMSFLIMCISKFDLLAVSISVFLSFLVQFLYLLYFLNVHFHRNLSCLDLEDL